MKLSIFTTATNPGKRGDLDREALTCFAELADEIIYVDGSGDFQDGEESPFYPEDMFGNRSNIKEIYYKWPQEFDWLQISRSYQKGYDACTGDWALFADLDFIFHEKDFEAIRQACENNPDAPALSFYKYQFVLPDRYNLKSRRVILINKAKFGDRIKLNGGGDLCQVTLDGKHLTPDDVPESGIAFYNYEKLLKTKEQIMNDVGRMERAYKRQFGKYQYGEHSNDEEAYNLWIKAQKGKLNKPSERIPLEAHPKYVQETIKNLKPENFGYDGHGFLERNDYVS